MCEYCKGEKKYKDIDTGYSFCEIDISPSGKMNICAGQYNECDDFEITLNFCPNCGEKLGEVSC